ncbi:MAG: transporter substrate-binding domain-containing protein [Comamonas sp.]|nr:transporter substrate-binding domain-containing protein [Candidatus Comamonas equi]
MKPFTLHHIVLSLTALAALSTASAHASGVLENIERTKKVRIAIPTDYPPYGMVGIDMKPQGLDIDMAHYVAGKLGAKAELIPVVSANRVPYLQTGKVDLVISTLGKTEERAKVVDFSHSYSPFFQALFAPQKLSIKDWSDLTGKTISVTRGAMADAELTKVAPAGAQIRRFEDHIATVSAFASGQVQAIATSAGEGDTIAKQAPKLNSELKLILKVSPNFIGVNKGETALLERINAIVLEAKHNGELDRLSKKWLKQPAGDLPL